jgi:hypothetical protein
VLEELVVKDPISIELYYDNNVIIEIEHNLVQYDHAKHIEVDCHFIKDYFDNAITLFIC